MISSSEAERRSSPRWIVRILAPLALLAALSCGFSAPAGAQVASDRFESPAESPFRHPSSAAPLLPLDLTPVRHTAAGAAAGAAVGTLFWVIASEGEPWWQVARGPVLFGAGIGLLFDAVHWFGWT